MRKRSFYRKAMIVYEQHSQSLELTFGGARIRKSFVEWRAKRPLCFLRDWPVSILDLRCKQEKNCIQLSFGSNTQAIVRAPNCANEQMRFVCLMRTVRDQKHFSPEEIPIQFEPFESHSSALCLPFRIRECSTSSLRSRQLSIRTNSGDP